MHPARLRSGPSQSRPLTDASPGSARSPGLRVWQAAPSPPEYPYTRSSSNRMPVLSSLSGQEVNDIAQAAVGPRRCPLMSAVDEYQIQSRYSACAEPIGRFRGLPRSDTALTRNCLDQLARPPPRLRSVRTCGDGALPKLPGAAGAPPPTRSPFAQRGAGRIRVLRAHSSCPYVRAPAPVSPHSRGAFSYQSERKPGRV